MMGPPRKRRRYHGLSKQESVPLSPSRRSLRGGFSWLSSIISRNKRVWMARIDFRQTAAGTLAEHKEDKDSFGEFRVGFFGPVVFAVVSRRPSGGRTKRRK